jgi:hypothetical protein
VTAPTPRPYEGVPAPGDDVTGTPPPYGSYDGYAGYGSYAGYGGYGGYGAYAGAPPYAGGYGPPYQQGNGMAVAGLVLGIISAALFILNWVDTVVGILAVVFSAIAFSRARRAPQAGRGGMALWGLVLGSVGVVASIVTLVLLVVLGSRMAERCEDHIGHRPTSAELDQCARDGI